MVNSGFRELVSGCISKVKGVLSHIRLEEISKPIALLGSGILLSILSFSPAGLVGILPEFMIETADSMIRKYARRKGVPPESPIDKTLESMSGEEMRSLLLDLQERMDDLMREDKEARSEIMRLIKEGMRSEELLDYLNEQQSLAVLIQENLKELVREFPDLREDVKEVSGKIDSLMDQVRDVRRLLIELRGDIQKIVARETGSRERTELKTKLTVTLGQMRTSSNLPEEMRVAYQAYYFKAVAKKMEIGDFEELMGKTGAWETDVVELTRTSARLVDAGGSEFVLSREPLVLGRAPGYEAVRLEDPYVSRFHACILYDGKSGQYQIRDLNSTNGTFVNRRQVRKSPVRSGDEIMMGRAAASVEIDEKLRIVSASGMARTLEGYLMVLGRSPSAKILVCKDPYVSRIHALIVYDPGSNSYRIRDLNSTNGTFVNNEGLTREQILKNGDVISLWRTPFTFKLGG